MLVSPANQASGIAFRPRLDLQPCSTEIVRIRGYEVHHAFLTERYGPHEAVWQANGHTFMLLTKPSTDTDSKVERIAQPIVARRMTARQPSLWSPRSGLAGQLFIPTSTSGASGYEIPIDPPVVGDRVRIELVGDLRGDSFLHIAELEAYAPP